MYGAIICSQKSATTRKFSTLEPPTLHNRLSGGSGAMPSQTGYRSCVRALSDGVMREVEPMLYRDGNTPMAAVLLRTGENMPHDIFEAESSLAVARCEKSRPIVGTFPCAGSKIGSRALSRGRAILRSVAGCACHTGALYFYEGKRRLCPIA